MKTKSKILIIDDEPQILELMALALEGSGYTVRTALDGAAGLAKIRQEPFDLVFLDISMPGLDGIAVLKEIRQIAPDIAVIMLTGYPTQEKVIASFKLKVSNFISKPIQINTIVKVAEDALEERKNSRLKRPE